MATKGVENGTTLNDATDNLLAERGKTHGHIEDNAYFTEELGKIVVAKPQNSENLLGKCHPPRLCLWMVLHKIGRILSGNWREPDHWRDIAGLRHPRRRATGKGELQ